MIERRPALRLVAGVAILVLLGVGLRVMLQPDRVTGYVLRQMGSTLALEISASGGSSYRLRGGPSLLVRNVRVSEPGATRPLLAASRVYVAVPWATVRNRGEQLDITRIELDSPMLDIDALQHWLAARPSSGTTRIPALADGLSITDGGIVGEGWHVDGFALSLPRLHEDQPLDARSRGVAHVDGLDAHFNLAIAMTQPALRAGVAVIGPITVDGDDWTMQSRLRAGGSLDASSDALHITRLRTSVSGRYRSGDTSLPFAAALSSPLHYRDGKASLPRAGLALRGEGMIPDVDASGALGLDENLGIDLAGRIANWPAQWPALPQPMASSKSPLPFALQYHGKPDLSDTLSLQLSRDDSRLDADLQRGAILEWIANLDAGSPLPPVDGRFSTPTLLISGAMLEGVEVEITNDTPAP